MLLYLTSKKNLLKIIYGLAARYCCCELSEKTATKIFDLIRIWNWDPGSGSRIHNPDTGSEFSKRPGSGSAFNVCGSETLLYREAVLLKHKLTSKSFYEDKYKSNWMFVELKPLLVGTGK